MQKFHMDFHANNKGMEYFNLCLRALNHPDCAAKYEYTIDYVLPDTESPVGISHRITWWRKYTGEQR